MAAGWLVCTRRSGDQEIRRSGDQEIRRSGCSYRERHAHPVTNIGALANVDEPFEEDLILGAVCARVYAVDAGAAGHPIHVGFVQVAVKFERIISSHGFTCSF
jgi:hypothetical protein